MGSVCHPNTYKETKWDGKRLRQRLDMSLMVGARCITITHLPVSRVNPYDYHAHDQRTYQVFGISTTSVYLN